MDGNVLHYEATGPFNAEVFDLLAVAQLEFLQSLTLTGPWASICTVRGSAMVTPEGLERYTELMQRPKPDHFEPVATAFVIGPEVEGGRIMASYFEGIYRLIRRPLTIVATMDDAQNWVQAKIAQGRNSS